MAALGAKAFIEQLDHSLLLGDEGVDACRLGVEVVGDRPLSVRRRAKHGEFCERVPAAEVGAAFANPSRQCPR